MPLYEYVCWIGGHRFEARASFDDYDQAQQCPVHRAGYGKRVLSLPQRPIVRPLGYSLRPGDAGYWQFETAQGRPEPKAIEPFAKLRDLEANPGQLAPDDLPAALIADAPRSPGPASPDVRLKE